MPNHARRAAAALGAVAAGGIVWSTLVERRLFTLRHAELPILPDGASPVRVLHLSDLHLAPWQTNKIDWVRSLEQLHPDLVVLTGDLMGHTQAQPALILALQPLLESTPAVFVHGSNDYYGPMLKNPVKYLLRPSRVATKVPDIDNAALTRALERIGGIDLNNSATRLSVRDVDIDLIGLNDPHISLADAALMRERFADLRRTPAPVRIGVVHAPYQDALGALLDDEAQLILAGHTHGGQVRVPGIGALTSNCDLPTAQARGLSVWYDAHRAAFLNVSAGLGNSIYAPVRFACRPEASLITLEAAR